jgi:hypothetical protein
MTRAEHKERFFRTLAYTCWTMWALLSVAVLNFDPHMNKPMRWAAIPVLLVLALVFTAYPIPKVTSRSSPQTRGPEDLPSSHR